MKKVFLTVLLVLCLTGGMLYADDDTSKTESGFDWDIRFGISFPYLSNFGTIAGSNDKTLQVLGGVLSPLVYSSLSLGVGFQYTIVPHVLAPGIYADVHFNALSWFLVGMFSDWKYNFLLLQPGVRFYNQFQITKNFGIEPFYGFNFMYIGIPMSGADGDYKKSLVLANAGIVLKLGSSFGIEYCYIIPNNMRTQKANGEEENWAPSVHRFSFSWGLRDR